MKLSTRLVSAALVGALAFAGVACGGDDDTTTDEETTEEMTEDMTEETT